MKKNDVDKERKTVMKISKLMKPALCVLLVFLYCMSLAGCSAGNRFVGKWRSVTNQSSGYQQIVLEFRSDGTASLNGEEVEYVIEADRNVLRINKGFYYSECTYKFNGSKKLTLTGENAYYFLTGDYEKSKN